MLKSCHHVKKLSFIDKKQKLFKKKRYPSDKMVSYGVLINVICTIGSTRNMICPEDQSICEYEWHSSNETVNYSTISVTNTGIETIEDDISSEIYNYECPTISVEYFFRGTPDTDEYHKEDLKQYNWATCRMKPLKYCKPVANNDNGQIGNDYHSSSIPQQMDSHSIKRANCNHRIKILKYLIGFIISINNDYMVECSKQYNVLYDAAMDAYKQLIELSHVVSNNDIPTIRNNMDELLAELQASTVWMYSNTDIIRVKMDEINKDVYGSYVLYCKGWHWSININRFVVDNMPEFASHITRRQDFINLLLKKTNISLKLMSNQCDDDSNTIDDRPCVVNFKFALQQLSICVKNAIKCNKRFMYVASEGSLFLNRIKGCIPSTTTIID